MALHVQDEETDWLVRDFARRRGVGITAAIKLAIEEATEKERIGVEMAKQRLEPIWKEIRAMKPAEPHDHRKFVDEMWED
jgi:antitoxin VapB